MHREKSYRGISQRLAIHYLEGLGAELVDGHEDRTGVEVEADDWGATLTTERVGVGPTVKLTQVNVTFEGDEEVLPELIEEFGQKAMRAGG